jgi:hypothetical protein
MTEFAYFDPNDPSTVYVSQPPIAPAPTQYQAPPPHQYQAPPPQQYQSPPPQQYQAPAPVPPPMYAVPTASPYPAPMPPPSNYGDYNDEPDYAPVPGYNNQSNTK